MSDLIERLRNPKVGFTDVDGVSVPSMYDYEVLCDEAADEIERLDAIVGIVVNALEMVASHNGEGMMFSQRMDKARQALKAVAEGAR